MTEAEHELIQAIRDVVDYWRREKRADRNDAFSGLAHSILCVLDGSGGPPCYDLIRKGEDEPEVTISTMLHELLYQDEWR